MKNNVILLLIMIIFISLLSCDFGKEENKQISYKGIIVNIYRDNKFKHGEYVSTIKNDSLEFVETIDLYPKSWEYAEIGDSIIKPADTLMIIIKKNDSTYREFFYKF